jgi:hypothetical protein
MCGLLMQGPHVLLSCQIGPSAISSAKPLPKQNFLGACYECDHAGAVESTLPARCPHLNMSWLAALLRSRLFSSSRQSCTMTPPSAQPSSLSHSKRGKAPTSNQHLCPRSPGGALFEAHSMCDGPQNNNQHKGQAATVVATLKAVDIH